MYIVVGETLINMDNVKAVGREGEKSLRFQFADRSQLRCKCESAYDALVGLAQAVGAKVEMEATEVEYELEQVL